MGHPSKYSHLSPLKNLARMKINRLIFFNHLVLHINRIVLQDASRSFSKKKNIEHNINNNLYGHYFVSNSGKGPTTSRTLYLLMTSRYFLKSYTKPMSNMAYNSISRAHIRKSSMIYLSSRKINSKFFFPIAVSHEFLFFVITRE